MYDSCNSRWSFGRKDTFWCVEIKIQLNINIINYEFSAYLNYLNQNFKIINILFSINFKGLKQLRKFIIHVIVNVDDRIDKCEIA